MARQPGSKLGHVIFPTAIATVLCAPCVPCVYHEVSEGVIS